MEKFNIDQTEALMQEDFSNLFWTWYATDQHRLVLRTCKAMKALDFLRASASVQSTRIPYCPACETWSEMMLPIENFLVNLPFDISPTLKETLSTVWFLCNELPKDAFSCDDFEMFYASAWIPLRVAANEALRCLEWDNLHPYLNEVMLECYKVL